MKCKLKHINIKKIRLGRMNNIRYEQRIEQIRKQTRRNIEKRKKAKQSQKNKYLQNTSNVERFRQFFSTEKKVGTYLLSLALPLSIFLVLIILLPSFVVQINGNPEVTSASKENMTTTAEAEESLIDVSIKRSDTEAIETVPLEQYVASVVASEMPAKFELDALKAQAIAARTYMVNHLIHEGDEVISDTVDHQVYRNEEELKTLWGEDFNWKWEKIKRAVKETENLILTYEDQPITPTFFSMSNGYTEDAENYWGTELPYLKSVQSKWEEEEPNFVSQEIFTVQELNDRLNLQLKTGIHIPITTERTPSNRIKEITIAGESFSGRTIRESLQLRSTDFTVEQKGEHFIFTTKGYGHGVGMSQYGANGMAKEGKNFEEILAHYYDGIDIMNVSDLKSDIQLAMK